MTGKRLSVFCFLTCLSLIRTRDFTVNMQDFRKALQVSLIGVLIYSRKTLKKRKLRLKQMLNCQLLLTISSLYISVDLKMLSVSSILIIQTYIYCNILVISSKRRRAVRLSRSPFSFNFISIHMFLFVFYSIPMDSIPFPFFVFHFPSFSFLSSCFPFFTFYLIPLVFSSHFLVVVLLGFFVSLFFCSFFSSL